MHGPELEIGMPVFIDGIRAIAKAEAIRTGVLNCREMEKKREIIDLWNRRKQTNLITRTGEQI